MLSRVNTELNRTNCNASKWTIIESYRTSCIDICIQCFFFVGFFLTGGMHTPRSMVRFHSTSAEPHQPCRHAGSFKWHCIHFGWIIQHRRAVVTLWKEKKINHSRRWWRGREIKQLRRAWSSWGKRWRNWKANWRRQKTVSVTALHVKWGHFFFFFLTDELLSHLMIKLANMSQWTNETVPSRTSSWIIISYLWLERITREGGAGRLTE